MVLHFRSSRLWVSPCCLVATLPISHRGPGSPATRHGGSARLQSRAKPPWVVFFGRKLQPQARMVQTRDPCPGYNGPLMSFPSPSTVSQWTWQSLIPFWSSTPYPTTHRPHSQWRFAKTGLSGGVWTGTRLREMSTLPRKSVPGPVPVPESCPCCWEKSLLGATQRPGGQKNQWTARGLGFINASLSVDWEQKH